MNQRWLAQTRWTTGVTVCAVAATWLMVVLLTVPRAQSPGIGDYGFFTAVAERLRAGDVLYTDVWDNKDPFVFYSIALFRSAGALGAWVLELMWVALASAAAFVIARRAALSPNVAAFVSLVLSPLVLLGYPYFMGSTHLPGVALVLAALALILLDRPAVAGVALGLLIFVKFVMIPLAIAVVATMLVVRRRPYRLVPVSVGALATISVVCLLMLLRGELGGFARTQIDNILYSQSPIVSASYTGLDQKIAQHVVILVNGHVLVVLVTSLGILLASGLIHRSTASSRQWSFLPVLWWVSAVGLGLEVVTIAISGKWLHHAEILTVSSVLLLILLTGSLTIARRSPLWLVVMASTIVAILLAGAPSPTTYRDAATGIRDNWTAANDVDPLTEILRPMEPTSVAFVGRGNLVPRSAGLEDWDIACRHIAQRPFNAPFLFDETVACLPTAQLVVVAGDYGRDAAFPAYSDFVDSVEEILARDFRCEDVQGFRLCRRLAS